MKNARILSIILAVALVFTLLPAFGTTAAFADGQGNNYTVSYADANTASVGANYVNPVGFTDQGIYCTGSERIGSEIPEGATEEYPGQYDVYQNVLVFISFDGSVRKLDYSTFRMEKEHPDKYAYESDCYMQGIRVLPDGNLAELAVFSESWSNTPDANRNNENFWSDAHYSQEYYLRILSPEGTEKSVFLIPTLDDEYIGPFGSDRDGNVVCSVGSRLISVNPQDGTPNWVQEVNVYPDRVITLADGSLAFTAWGDESLGIYFVDAATGVVSTPSRIPSDAYLVTPGEGEYPLYYSNGSAFFGFVPGDGTKTCLLNWINLDIAVEVSGDVLVRDDGTITGVIPMEDDSQGVRIFTITPADGPFTGDKKVITLATPWLDYEKRAQVLAFNRENDAIHVNIADYSVYNADETYGGSTEAWNGGVRKLEEDLLNGFAPDIIDLNSLSVERLAARGLLEDLYPYLDADATLNRDDYFSTVLSSAEIDGKLLYTVPGFGINTLMGEPSVVGDHPGWNYRDFRAALSSMKPGARALNIYTTSADVLERCFSMNFDRYVNLADGTCSFENGDYLDLLTFASSFPAEYSWENYSYEQESDYVSLQEGRQMLVSGYLSSIYEMLYSSALFGGKPFTCIGYPVGSGTGNFFSIQPGFGISSASANKNEAWQFIRRWFTPELQAQQYFMPTSREAFRAKLDEAMTVEYRKDDSGELLLDANGEPIPEMRASVLDANGEEKGVYALTQQDADQLLELVETTTRRETVDPEIEAVILEQAYDFLHGTKSAEETARLTQEAVQAYLASNS